MTKKADRQEHTKNKREIEREREREERVRYKLHLKNPKCNLQLTKNNVKNASNQITKQICFVKYVKYKRQT